MPVSLLCSTLIPPIFTFVLDTHLNIYFGCISLMTVITAIVLCLPYFSFHFSSMWDSLVVSEHSVYMILSPTLLII